jgi:hypothetical protein
MWLRVIVFPARDVAAGAVEVDLSNARQLRFSDRTGDADDVAAHSALPVVALSMTRVEADRHHRIIAVPEADRSQVRIDESFRSSATPLVTST